jgi:RNA polymerase sigma-70 factor (ECF subfamily)
MAVRLRYLEELTLAEVAEALDVPIGTVKSRIAYGIELLRRRVGPLSRL